MKNILKLLEVQDIKQSKKWRMIYGTCQQYLLFYYAIGLQYSNIIVQICSNYEKISKKLYKNLIKDIKKYMDPKTDSIRIYKLNRDNKILNFGVNKLTDLDEIKIL